MSVPFFLNYWVIFFFNWRKFKAEVNCEQFYRFYWTLEGYYIYFSAVILNSWIKSFVKVTWNQKRHFILLCCSFKSWRQVDVWTQVAGIYFEVTTNSTFNSPTLMQTEAHAHFVISLHSLAHQLVIIVVNNGFVFVNLRNYFDEAENRKVCNVPIILTDPYNIFISDQFRWFLFNLKLPNQKKCFTNIFVDLSSVLCHLWMRNFSNLVDKSHNFFLKHFRRIRKIP